MASGQAFTSDDSLAMPLDESCKGITPENQGTTFRRCDLALKRGRSTCRWRRLSPTEVPKHRNLKAGFDQPRPDLLLRPLHLDTRFGRKYQMLQFSAACSWVPLRWLAFQHDGIRAYYRHMHSFALLHSSLPPAPLHRLVPLHHRPATTDTDCLRVVIDTGLY